MQFNIDIFQKNPSNTISSNPINFGPLNKRGKAPTSGWETWYFIPKTISSMPGTNHELKASPKKKNGIPWNPNQGTKVGQQKYCCYSSPQKKNMLHVLQIWQIWWFTKKNESLVKTLRILDLSRVVVVFLISQGDTDGMFVWPPSLRIASRETWNSPKLAKARQPFRWMPVSAWKLFKAKQILTLKRRSNLGSC